MIAKRWMLLALVITTGAGLARAQFLTGRFATSVYAWKQFDTVGTSANQVRAFQTVQLSYAQGDIALHSYLQGGAGGTSDIGKVRAINLYADWTNIAHMLDLSLGRQAVYAGVANGTIDGLRAAARLLENQVRVSAFAGANVNPDFTGIRKNIHDNTSFGGQVITTMVPDFRIGLSYLNRREERDPYWALRVRDTSTFSPVLTYINMDSEAEQYGSIDASYAYGSLVTVYGRYDYDINLSRSFRAQGNARVSVTDQLAVTADYMYRAPRVAYNSIFSVFTLNSVNEIEGGLEYALTPTLRAFGRLAYVKYTDDKNDRWTLGLNSIYGSFSYSGSTGYAGELQALSIQGAYPLLDRLVTPTLGLSYASYRLSADDPRLNTFALLLGADLRPMNAFSFGLQGQLMTNRLYKNDVRLQARIMYWFAERLSTARPEGTP